MRPPLWWDPTQGCGDLPAEHVYERSTNPGGVRCTLPDYWVNELGRRGPQSWTSIEKSLGRGFAARFLDNVGVQYGLTALQTGDISPEQFVDLNEKVGGMDIDFAWQPTRTLADSGRPEGVSSGGRPAAPFAWMRAPRDAVVGAQREHAPGLAPASSVEALGMLAAMRCSPAAAAEPLMELADRSWSVLPHVIAGHTLAYRLTGGLIGHRMPTGTTFLLLDHVGARSGRRRTSPLLYFRDGENVVVVASKGGHPRHPGWFHNLRANPDTTVQIGSRRRAVRARVATPDERVRLWPRAVKEYGGYTAYQERTGRQIPLVILEPR